jgi:hypothetical protein
MKKGDIVIVKHVGGTSVIEDAGDVVIYGEHTGDRDRVWLLNHPRSEYNNRWWVRPSDCVKINKRNSKEWAKFVAWRLINA